MKIRKYFLEVVDRYSNKSSKHSDLKLQTSEVKRQSGENFSTGSSKTIAIFWQRFANFAKFIGNEISKKVLDLLILSDLKNMDCYCQVIEIGLKCIKIALII